MIEITPENTPELDRLRKNHTGLFSQLFGGMTPGAVYVTKLFQALHVYDDLIDKDKRLTPDEIHAAFWLTMIDLPNDPFFLANRLAIMPLLVNSIINWRVANNLERLEEPSEHHLGMAWILRGSYIDLLSQALALERGPAYAIQVGQLVRAWAHHETFEVYKSNLDQEKAAQNV